MEHPRGWQGKGRDGQMRRIHRRVRSSTIFLGRSCLHLGTPLAKMKVPADDNNNNNTIYVYSIYRTTVKVDFF